MKKTLALCFCTDQEASGNPAAIIEDFTGNDAAKQQLATQLNLPVTVFISKPANEYLFRFFYPAKEMPLCIHGALAAAYVLMQKHALTQLTVMTQQQQKLNIMTSPSGFIQMQIEPGQMLPSKIAAQDIDAMLGIATQNFLDTKLPCGVASVGSPKLLIPLLKYSTLAALKPNFDFIKSWSEKNNINGLYVYTQDHHGQPADYSARGFNPKGGSQEDAATGVAAGALYTALQLPNNKEIHIAQGEFMGRPSRIVVASQARKLLIGGKVRCQTK